MSKYLFCVILGIIIFLMYNRINGFSIGGKDIGDFCYGINDEECNDGLGNCDDNCICFNYECEKETPDQTPDQTIQINLIGENDSDSRCTTSNSSCVTTTEAYIDPRDICLDNANSIEEQQYHTGLVCGQSCDLELVIDDIEMNLENAGFQRFQNFLDPNHAHTHLMVEKINEDYSSRPVVLEHNGLTFPEYLFRNYLEKQNTDFCMRKIKDGIYYINNKLYICYSDKSITTRVVSNGELDTTNPIYDRILGRYIAPESFGTLHMDTQNTVKWSKLPDDPLSVCNSRATRLIGKEDYTLQDFNRDILERWNKWGFDLSRHNTKLINIWILLHGTVNVKTLGFMDFIDERNPDLYRSMDGTLKNLATNNNDTISTDRLFPFFQPLVVYPRIYNIEPGENISPRTIYTYTMNPNDALIFNSDIPHIGLNGSLYNNPNNVRISIESRFEYIDVDVDLVFNITYESEVCAVDVSKENASFDSNTDEYLNDLRWSLFLIPPNINLQQVVIDDLNQVFINEYVTYIKNLYKIIAYIYNFIYIHNYLKKDTSITDSQKSKYPLLESWTILDLREDVIVDAYGRFNDIRICKQFLDTIPYDVLNHHIFEINTQYNPYEPTEPSTGNTSKLEMIIIQFLTITVVKNVERLMTEAGLGYIYNDIKDYLESIGIDEYSSKDDLIDLYDEQEEATEGDSTELQNILDLIDDDNDKRRFSEFIYDIYTHGTD